MSKFLEPRKIRLDLSDVRFGNGECGVRSQGLLIFFDYFDGGGRQVGDYPFDRQSSNKYICNTPPETEYTTKPNTTKLEVRFISPGRSGNGFTLTYEGKFLLTLGFNKTKKVEVSRDVGSEI